jgi:hypothetical protein
VVIECKAMGAALCGWGKLGAMAWKNRDYLDQTVYCGRCENNVTIPHFTTRIGTAGKKTRIDLLPEGQRNEVLAWKVAANKGLCSISPFDWKIHVILGGQFLCGSCDQTMYTMQCVKCSSLTYVPHSDRTRRLEQDPPLPDAFKCQWCGKLQPWHPCYQFEEQQRVLQTRTAVHVIEGQRDTEREEKKQRRQVRLDAERKRLEAVASNQGKLPDGSRASRHTLVKAIKFQKAGKLELSDDETEIAAFSDSSDDEDELFDFEGRVFTPVFDLNAIQAQDERQRAMERAVVPISHVAPNG